MEKTSPSILVVEDETPLREVLADRLEDEGYTVFKAKNGNEGLSLALKHHPDLILLDIVMPKMDGTTLLKFLREDDWGKTVDVILLTNLSGSKEVADAIEQNVHDYLVKSDWKIEEVMDKIKQKLEKKTSEKKEEK